MAHGIKRGERIKLNQVLHGYADGHRQLATSATLKQRDIKTMLVMSDISGPGARIDEAGYLTGYPLTESGVYALARTWAAPEMPRPGCVWTHTILIDFADLATLTSLSNLVSLFRRPDGLLFGDYGKTLTLGNDLNDEALSGKSLAWSRRVLAALYGRPLSRVIATRPVAMDVDQVVLALWAQQWPRLRRGFRFCTLAAGDRSGDGSSFDLQLLPSTDRNIRARFPETIDADSVEGMDGPWLDDTIEDLFQPDVSGLRSFIRRIGADVATGREVFRSLCRLHLLVETFKSRPEAIDEAISLLQDELGSVQARVARAMVVGAALDHVDVLNDAALNFLLAHLDLIDTNQLEKCAELVGRTVWSRDPVRFVNFLDDSSGVLSVVPRFTFAALSVSELADGLRRAPTLEDVALSHRPDLVTEPSFWLREHVAIDNAFKVAVGSDQLRSPALAALVTAQRDDLAARAVHEFGSLAALQVVGSEIELRGERQGLKLWVEASSKDPSSVAQYLASGPAKPRALLVALARFLPPDAVPNDFGTDPWLIAYQEATGSMPAGTAIYLNAYFLCRALGSSSHNAGELAEIGFEATHIAAASNCLPDEAWRLLDPRLPESFLRIDWDRCKRIRTGIVDLFIERDLAPQYFARLTRDENLFMDLAYTAAQSRRGRYFLMQVSQAMKNNFQNAYKSRILGVEKLLHLG